MSRTAVSLQSARVRKPVSITNKGSLAMKVNVGNIDRAVGTLTYTQLLNARGGIEADVTVVRVAEDEPEKERRGDDPDRADPRSRRAGPRGARHDRSSEPGGVPHLRRPRCSRGGTTGEHARNPQRPDQDPARRRACRGQWRGPSFGDPRSGRRQPRCDASQADRFDLGSRSRSGNMCG